MHVIDWILMFLPFTAVLGLAVYARKYARDAVDFLAAGRVAGHDVENYNPQPCRTPLDIPGNQNPT